MAGVYRPYSSMHSRLTVSPLVTVWERKALSVAGVAEMKSAASAERPTSEISD
jgi:hypothetical protein